MHWWWIAHFLTGRHFVHISHEYHGTEVRMVRYTASGRAYVKWCFSNYIWLDEPGRWVVVPLTVRQTKPI